MLYVIVNQNTLSNNEEQLITKLMSLAKVEDFEIINIRYYKIPDKKNTFLTFGKEAAQAIKLSNTSSQVIELPEIARLRDLPGNEEARMIAWQKIQELGSYMNLIDKLSNPANDPLSHWTIREVMRLEKLSPDKTGITVFTKDSQTLRIKFTLEDNVNGNINITFAELLAIKLATEIFKGNQK